VVSCRRTHPPAADPTIPFAAKLSPGAGSADARTVANSIVGDVAAGTPNAIVQRIRGRRRTG
jgi:hypothetical protein